MDAQRVHELAAGRRAILRRRTYFVLIAAGCLLAAGQAMFLLFTSSPVGGRRVALCAIAALGVGGVVRFGRKVVSINQRLSKPALAEPTRPPDFGPLSDGSQQAAALERMGRGERGMRNEE